MTRGLVRLLGTLCGTTFLIASTGTAIAPFLLDLARDLQTDLGAAANLVSLMSLTWGAASLAAGTASDRLGRRPILVAAVLTSGVARLGLAASGTYGAAAAWQLLSGAGGGAFMGTVFAAVSDHVPPERRGRALGWVVTGQSLSLVFGVPLLTLIGSLGGWRGAIATQGAATLLAALAVRLVVPRGRRVAAGATLPLRAVARLFDARTVALLGAGTMERVCFAAVTVYLAAFLVTAYGVSLAELAGGLALVAVGNLAGNVLGGHLSDRVAARPLAYAASAVATGLVALPLLLWRPGLAVSLGLGFAYSLTNALGRPALLATLSEVSAEARGAVLGLNITTASVGWISAAAVGGWLVTRAGFGSLGLFCAAAAALGAALATGGWWAGRRPAPRR